MAGQLADSDAGSGIFPRANRRAAYDPYCPSRERHNRCFMQLDFHYYAVYHLAELAGLSSSAAETVAYASQYVDDATESEPVVPFPDQQFDTVRTAHYNLGAFDWNVQKKIYMPFHFLPATIRWSDPAAFSYVTRPASLQMNDLAAKLVQNVLAEPEPAFRQIRMGVALHTIADTFSHFGFSGRQSEENHVGRIWHAKKGGGWDYKFLKSYADIFIPEIGHVQSFEYPDLPYLTWRYKNHQGKYRKRDNTVHCLKGTRLIYKILSHMSDPNNTSADLKADFPGQYEKIRTLFAKPGNTHARNKRWRSYTGAPVYDPLQWRKAALTGDVQWDAMSRPQRMIHINRGKDGFDTSNWARFHRAAHLQRSRVLAWLN